MSRLREARYNPNVNTAAADADLLRRYQYAFDLSGNRLAELLSGTDVTATHRYFGYNAANQLTAEGDTLDGNNQVIPDYTYEYDANGNLRYKKDTAPNTLETYTWNRANRLIEVDNGTPAELTAYAYDGLNNRISQAIGMSSPVVTQYLLDMQPGLVKVIAATTGGNTDRFIHAPRGIHAMEDHAGNWTYAVQDALGNVRSEMDSLLAVQGSRQLTPYLTPFDEVGSFAIPFVGTGEMRDPIGIQYHRSRYLNPSIGTFLSLDPFEGTMQLPMSLNGYSWVEGNTPNMADPWGLCGWSDYETLKIFMPQLMDAAHRWNRIALGDCANPTDSCNPVRTLECQCKTGLSDEAFAALMAAIIHNENRLAIGTAPLTISEIPIIYYEMGGIMLGFLGIRESSEGIANLKMEVINQILNGVIPIRGPEDVIPFDIDNRLDSVIATLEWFTAQYKGYLFEDFVRDFHFRQQTDVSIELLAANIYRGIVRAKSPRTETISDATIFNLAAWHNLGHQEANDYDKNPVGIARADSVVYANSVIRYMAQIVEGDCDLGLSPKPVPWRDFLYYNSVDSPYVDFDGWNGTLSPHRFE